MLVIDTHCHILPALDDGARILDEAVEMARGAAKAGTRVIVATPHWAARGPSATGDFLRRQTAALGEALAANGVDVRVEPGAEVALTPSLLETAGPDTLPTLAGSEYVLVEMPTYLDWDLARRVFFELQLRSVKIILAHPERTAALCENYERAQELRAGGIKLQVVLPSLVGQMNRFIRALARRLVRDGLADLLASDAHDAAPRSVQLARARKLVDKLGGPGTFERLTVTGPASLLGIDT